MRDRFFDMADNVAETFARVVLALLFVACTLYLTVEAGPLGLAFFFIVLSFARWVWHKTPEADDAVAERDGQSVPIDV